MADGKAALRVIDKFSVMRERFEELKRIPTLDRSQRIAALTEIAFDSDSRASDRLKALELLGKIEGDYIERVAQTDGDGNSLPVVTVVITRDEALTRARSVSKALPGEKNVDEE